MKPAKAKVGIPGSARKISRSVPSQFPAHFKDSDSLLIAFIQAYYEWMEKDKGIISDIDRLVDFMDIDKTDLDRFGQFFRDEFLPSIPSEVIADKRLLTKHIRQFYRARGSEKSFKFLFRILYNEDVTIEYPSDDILRASDGVWQKKRFLKVDAFDSQFDSVVGRKLYGIESNAVVIVESVARFISPSYSNAAELVVSGISGVLIPDEPLETRDPPGSNFPFVYSRVLGQVSSFVIVSGGQGYTTGEIIPFSSPGDGEGFIARVGSVDLDGSIKSIQIISTGVGYTEQAPVPDIAAMSGTGANFFFNVSSVYFSPGSYLDTRGQPSSLSRLQDGRFYQDYSYVLRSNIPVSEYLDYVYKLVHPAGMGVFGQLDNIDDDENRYVGFGRKILFHLSHPEDENFNNSNHPSSRRFYEPEIQFESKYVSFDLLQKQFPDSTIGDLFGRFLNEFWSVLTPSIVNFRNVDYSNIAYMARQEADTYIDLYDELPISKYESLSIGEIERITQYPNAKNSFIEAFEP